MYVDTDGMTPTELAIAAKTSTDMVRHFIRKNTIKADRIAGRYIIPKDVAEQFCASQAARRED